MPEQFFHVPEAAKRCQLSIRAFRDHLSERHIIPDGRELDGRLLFRASTLDAFRKEKRNPGRPPQKGTAHEDQPTREYAPESEGGEY